MQRSYLVALVIAVAATAWLASPYVTGLIWPATPGEDAAAPQAATDGQSEKPLRVRVRHSVAQTRVKKLMLTGQTEPSRQAMLKAETAGKVVSVGTAEGTVVKKGDVILGLSMDDRESRLDEAKALLDQRRIEYEAARKLTSKGFQTEVRLAEARSFMEAAKARLQQIQLDIDRTVIRAPFDGILQDRLVEIGDYVGIGDPVAVIVDLDPILAVAQMSEREATGVPRGGSGEARLVTGDVLDGHVRYVSVVGTAGTRTFRVELELPNAGGRIPAGMTAEISLPIADVEAHRLSPAALTLNDAGVVGVKTVDAENVVHFQPVELVADAADGVWLGGLPHEVTIITVGQEFVLPGQKVIPVPEDASGPTGPAAGGAS